MPKNYQSSRFNDKKAYREFFFQITAVRKGVCAYSMDTNNYATGYKSMYAVDAQTAVILG